MVQQPPGDGQNPIVNPFFVKEGLGDIVSPAEKEEQNEADKENETAPEDFQSFGDPEKLKQVKKESSE